MPTPRRWVRVSGPSERRPDACICGAATAVALQNRPRRLVGVLIVGVGRRGERLYCCGRADVGVGGDGSSWRQSIVLRRSTRGSWHTNPLKCSCRVKQFFHVEPTDVSAGLSDSLQHFWSIPTLSDSPKSHRLSDKNSASTHFRRTS